MCSGDTASICKLFVLGCLGFAVLQWPCMSEKTKSCHFFLNRFWRGVHNPTSFVIGFAKRFAQKSCTWTGVSVQHHTVCLF